MGSGFRAQGPAHPVCRAIKCQGGLLALLRVKLLEPRLVQRGDRVANLGGRNLLEIRSRLGAADPSQLCGFGLRGERGVSRLGMKATVGLGFHPPSALFSAPRRRRRRSLRKRGGERVLGGSGEGDSGVSDREVRGGEREASDRPHIQRLGGRHDDNHPLFLRQCLNSE
jgi:hypothetical protein